MSIKEIKSLRGGTPAADNKSLEYLIFEFHCQIQQRQFFFIATLVVCQIHFGG
jgi:hypothetical protein